MNPRIKSSAWREFFVQQMVTFSDEKSRFLDAYFPDPTTGRTAADQLLSGYTQALESHLASEDDCWCDRVLIGSRVFISYLDDMSTETLTIVSPHNAVLSESDSGECPVSFLSPMGRGLLLKRCGEQVDVHTPSGRLQVQIDRISLSEKALASGEGEQHES
jgi:transcription elongation factor GreA